MSYIRIDSTMSLTSVFQVVLRVLKRIAAHPAGAGGKPNSRVTDERALEAFSRMGDEQLNDIGVYRKVRRIKWDHLDRSLASEGTAVFDYFRLDG